MKKELLDLLVIYKGMVAQTRSKIRRECLENVIEDLTRILKAAQ